MKTGEQLLKQFCADYLAWVRGGAQAGHHVFRPDSGLCWLSWAWAGNLEDYLQLDDALYEAFKADGMHRAFPFNGAGLEPNLKSKAFYAEATAGECHCNPARLEFVIRHAK